MSMEEPSQNQLVPMTPDLNGSEENSGEIVPLSYPPPTNRCDVNGGDFAYGNFGHDYRTSTVNNNQKNVFKIYQGSQKRAVGSLEEALRPAKTTKEGDVQLPASITVFKSKPLTSPESSGEIFEGEKKKIGGVHKLAVKFLSKSVKAEREAESLEKVRNHPNVVNVYDTGEFSTDLYDKIYIAMERCSQTTLYHYLTENKNFDPQLAISHSTQIISGLEYIHGKGVAHRDLKPHNILFLEDGGFGQLKIADFGLSKLYLLDPLATRPTGPSAGTTGFRAAEAIKGEQRDETRCDIFSLGIVLVFILSNGKHPYGKDYWEWDLNIVAGKEPNLDQILLPNGTQRDVILSIIKKMLQYNPQNRPTAETLLKEWKENFNGNDMNGEHTATPDMDTSTTTSGEESCSTDNENPVDEESETIETPYTGVIGFTGGKLAYWRCTDELDLAPTLVADLITTIEDQTFTAVAVDRRVSVLTWLKRCYEFDLDYPNEGWAQLDSMNHLHGKYPPATVLRDKIYACGGGWEWDGFFRKENRPLPPASRRCEVFSKGKWLNINRMNIGRRGRWSDIADMREARGLNCVASLEGHVYSIAGWDRNRMPLKTVERYDPTKDEWSFTSQLNEARYNAAAVSHNGKLYVTGGLNAEQEPLYSTECFDRKTSTWTLLKTKLPRSGDRISAFVFGNQVVTLVGYEKLTTVQELPLEDEENQIELYKPYTGWLDAAIAVE